VAIVGVLSFIDDSCVQIRERDAEDYNTLKITLENNIQVCTLCNYIRQYADICGSELR